MHDTSKFACELFVLSCKLIVIFSRVCHKFPLEYQITRYFSPPEAVVAAAGLPPEDFGGFAVACSRSNGVTSYNTVNRTM